MQMQQGHCLSGFPSDVVPGMAAPPGMTAQQQPSLVGNQGDGAEGTVRGGALFASLARMRSSGGSSGDVAEGGGGERLRRRMLGSLCRAEGRTAKWERQATRP